MKTDLYTYTNTTASPCNVFISGNNLPCAMQTSCLHPIFRSQRQGSQTHNMTATETFHYRTVIFILFLTNFRVQNYPTFYTERTNLPTQMSSSHWLDRESIHVKAETTSLITMNFCGHVMPLKGSLTPSYVLFSNHLYHREGRVNSWGGSGIFVTS
jgi:hypothetical protein